MRYAYVTVVIIISAALLFGCAESPVGIFESIEFERKIVDDRNLPNELPVGAITTAANHYFIAAGSMWYRNANDADYPDNVATWAEVTSPLGNQNLTTNSLARFAATAGERIYVAYTSQDGTSAGVYAVDPAGLPDPDQAGYVPFEIADAAAVFTTAIDGVSGIDRLFVLDDGSSTYLAVAVGLSGTSRYGLYVSSTGASAEFTRVDGLETNSPIRDAATLPASSAVVLLTSRSIYLDADGINTGADPSNLAESLPLTDPADPDSNRQPTFGSIFFDSAGTLWMSDNEGYLYRSADLGTTWTTNSAAFSVSTNNDEALPFTDFAEVTNADFGRLVIVGTDGYGYRELRALDAAGVAATPLAIDAALTPVTPDAQQSNYQGSELAQASVLTFFVDSGVSGNVPNATGDNFTPQPGDRLFAGTSNLGLWKTLYYGVAPQWLRE